MERPESAQQFEEIFESHHDPLEIERRKYKKNQKERQELQKEDNGL